MEGLYLRCCGLDVHKSSIAACALLREQGRIRSERRRFTTMTQDLQDWLPGFGSLLDAIVAGQLDPEQLADLALGHLRAKIPESQLALSGKVR